MTFHVPHRPIFSYNSLILSYIDMLLSSIVSSISNILLFWSFALAELLYEHACPQ